MREVVYHIATTLDGFIARTDGSFSDFPWDEEFIAALMERYPETLPAPMRPNATRAENKRFGTVLMGRRTYEVGTDQGLTSPYPTLDQFVVSRTLSESPDPEVSLVTEDAPGFVRRLKADEGLAIWICGGSELATPLLEERLIDRLILKVNPVVFGDGIPLFRGEVASPTLSVASATTFNSGHSIVEYLVSPVS